VWIPQPEKYWPDQCREKIKNTLWDGKLFLWVLAAKLTAFAPNVL
jgi:hypothetical protein